MTGSCTCCVHPANILKITGLIQAARLRPDLGSLLLDIGRPLEHVGLSIFPATALWLNLKLPTCLLIDEIAHNHPHLYHRPERTKGNACIHACVTLNKVDRK